ncbi:hypothetical protein SEUCBS140593_001765 [Sporothrix eucalyptigena]|uniref:Calcineurin-like phosphoesterase domain-containing protein n=1 Tax=Sporothrix eucalyptigena TaxID=1812306 RepID=A0ABP0B0T8_9PEZI
MYGATRATNGHKTTRQQHQAARPEQEARCRVAAGPALMRATAASVGNTPVRVVCIADTHNKQPELPPGDVLIHAGDLTERGSFGEVQAGLAWLAAQPHKHKILVAGNHDVLLDEAFLDKYPERRYGQTDREEKEDLVWGGVTYLEDELLTV